MLSKFFHVRIGHPFNLSVQVFSPFSLGCQSFSDQFLGGLHILFTSPFSVYILKIFSPIPWFAFSFSYWYLSMRSVLILMKTNLSLFKKWIIILVMYLKTLCVIQGHKDIFSCVFFKSVTVFCFTFRSMMHIELIFGLKCEIQVKFPLFFYF